MICEKGTDSSSPGNPAAARHIHQMRRVSFALLSRSYGADPAGRFMEGEGRGLFRDSLVLLVVVAIVMGGLFRRD